ncbi:hypothetical protein [Patulibacter sp.]|uniref:hypothetical protein n=1 Tax=Patulibacter sp. TaxID=1912859 RepID=UPI0027170DAF|nr:hypothetical protein [Patulibacter sp.]MDO9410094.1 hypothetical protein [Patulibacter sp.]
MSWLEMKVDDLAFLVLREDRYSIVVRRTSEVDHGDALGTLLWSSGLDPSDSVVRGDAWRRLVRTLGGTGSTAEALTERLKKRGDKRLMPLVAPAEECVTLERNNVQWPPGWQYVLPAADCERYFCIRGVDDRVRALVGVMDGTGSLPPGLIEGDGGTLWLEASWGDESAVEAVKSLLTDPPVGLVPSAARQLWTRWVAGEHQARLAALTGSDWTVELGSGGWAYEGQSAPDLLSALEMIRPDASRPASAVQIRTSTNFPRNRLGFRDGVERLVESGVRFLRANPDTGFSAVLADGHTADGATLSELARRAAR